LIPPISQPPYLLYRSCISSKMYTRSRVCAVKMRCFFDSLLGVRHA